ncbi:MAG: hypothetical protein KGQ65_01130 [Burkholderiales bacterium]|nr:hypothetical protein [Burkholderiales bacterium]
MSRLCNADETLCAMCHLGEFKGHNFWDHVVKTLKDFKAKERNNGAVNTTLSPVV